MNHEKFISAIVLGYGKFDETSKKCLDSIIDDSKKIGMRLIAVDNYSPDDSAIKLLAYQNKNPSLEIQINKKNLGFGGGMNDAVKELETEWLLLINSDIIFPPKSLIRLVESLKICPNSIGIVAPLTNNAGNEQCIYIPGSSIEEIILNASEIHESPCGMLTPSYRADFCCVAIRSNLWEQLKGLDPQYGHGYYEDFDFSLRARSLGYECAVCEDSFVYHHGSLSFKSNPTQKALIKKNKNIFLNAHPKAKLQHQRDCNWSAIKNYMTNLNKSTILKRLRLRLELAKRTLPKSIFKRFLWNRKIKRLEKLLLIHQS